MTRRAVVLAACFVAALMWPASPSAHAARTDPIPPPPKHRSATPPASVLATLQVTDIHLETAPPESPQPSTVLRFDLRNDGEHSVADIVLEISVRERSAEGSPAARRLVAPFTISGHATVAAGYIVNYRMLLRNLSADCACVADVHVVSARELSDIDD